MPPRKVVLDWIVCPLSEQGAYALFMPCSVTPPRFDHHTFGRDGEHGLNTQDHVLIGAIGIEHKKVIMHNMQRDVAKERYDTVLAGNIKEYMISR